MTVQADRLFLASTARVARRQEVTVEDERLIAIREQLAVVADLVKKYGAAGKLSPEKRGLYEAKLASLRQFLEKKSKGK